MSRSIDQANSTRRRASFMRGKWLSGSAPATWSATPPPQLYDRQFDTVTLADVERIRLVAPRIDAGEDDQGPIAFVRPLQRSITASCASKSIGDGWTGSSTTSAARTAGNGAPLPNETAARAGRAKTAKSLISGPALPLQPRRNANAAVCVADAKTSPAPVAQSTTAVHSGLKHPPAPVRRDSLPLPRSARFF